MTPLIARLSEELAPGSLVVLRLWPAVFTSASILLGVLCARELGAGRLGQTATAVALALSPGLLASGHLLSTSTLDITLWVATTFLVLRILRTGDERLWLAVGAVLGVGLLNKWTIGFLVVGLLVGLLAGRDRRLLASRWFAAGVAVAAAIWMPNLLWQAAHDWPQIDMFVAIQDRSSGTLETALWFPLQLAIAGFLATPLWVAGLVRLFRSAEARRYRAVAIAYVVLAVLLAVLAGDKPYYVAALYLPLAAAGAVPFERWWERNRGRVRRVAIPITLAVLTVVGFPIVLPILPPETLADVPLQEANYDLGEQIGWPTFVDQIEQAWERIPRAERSSAIIVTGNYGEAGAIERHGDALPTPYSGHNTWWWWRTPPDGVETIVAVGIPREFLEQHFGQLGSVGTLDNGLGVDTEEQGVEIWQASDPLTSVADRWIDFRHYS